MRFYMNVYDELMEALEECGKDIDDIDFVVLRVNYDVKNPINVALKSPTRHALSEALNIDYEKDNRTVIVFGYIKFKDGTWLERAAEETGGFEWWQHTIPPDYVAAKLLCGILD